MRGTVEINGPKPLRPALRDDETGIALVYVAVALPVIIGFALLAIDVGRFSALNSSLQHGADALALAGAAELDGTTTAISRSEDAMADLVKGNTALFTSSTAATVTKSDVSTCYLSSLPTSDKMPIDPSACLSMSAADSRAAKFVQVKVEPKSYTTIFPATFIGAMSNTTETRAEAVAGFQAVACGFTPIFMCNPFEPKTGITDTFNDYGLAAAASDPNKRKAAIKLLELATGNTTTAVPGEFGYLDPLAGKGTKALGEEIASVSPDVCFALKDLTTVDPDPGSRTSLVHAFNTRFGFYDGSYNSNASRTAYPPARNVRKGWKNSGNSCPSIQDNNNPDPDIDKFMAMPVDKCFRDNSCGGIMGTGDWGWDPDTNNDVSFSRYWDTNFNWGPSSAGLSAPSPKNLGLGSSETAYTGTCSGSGSSYSCNTPPRYDIYKYENSKTTSSSSTYLYQEKSKGQESGEPSCNGPGVAIPDRRLIYGPVVNCRAENVRSGGSGYRSIGIATFFILRPMSRPSDPILWTELVGFARPGDGSNIVRDQVQLYR